MEGQEKSKKVAKEKRSVKKTKTVALPAKEIPAAPVAETPSVQQECRHWTAKRSSSLQQRQQRNRATSKFSSVRTLLASDAKAWESRVTRPLTGFRPSLN